MLPLYHYFNKLPCGMRRIPTSHPILKKQSPTFRASGLSVPALVLLPRLCYLPRLGSLWVHQLQCTLGVHFLHQVPAVTSSLRAPL